MEAWLFAAFKIALQAHGREAARRAVFDAVSWMDAATDASIRALKDRDRMDRSPIAPSMDEPQLLQRLVYKACDLIALQDGGREAARPREQLLARYLQFLLLFCLRRPARWSAVAISQLVYGYSGVASERVVRPFTRDLWDRSERRRAKRKLMSALGVRFPGLSVVPERAGIWGSDRHFAPCENQEQFVEVLPRWLRLFTPWNTGHGLTPESSLSSVPPELLETASLGAIHLFVCPGCFRILIQKLDHQEPAAMIRLPAMGEIYGD